MQPDGRAAYCAQAFTLKAPPGISVVLGAYPESVARRAFVLRDSAASPAARESWFDPALVCAGPDVAGGTTCSWGPGQEEVIFVPLPATRGVLVNIPEPRALETYYFAYWAEPPWASGEFVESLPAPGYSIHVSHCLARPPSNFSTCRILRTGSTSRGCRISQHKYLQLSGERFRWGLALSPGASR